MSWDRRVRRYQKFLKSLKRPESTLCSCPAHIHPRPWVPPPCLTSKAQNEESFSFNKRSLSNPELRMRSTSLHARDEDDDDGDQKESLQHLYKEARILKEAFNKARQGDHIPKNSRNVIRKWSKRSPERRTRSMTERYGELDDPREQIAELDKTFSEAVQEEEALRQELKNLRDMAQNRSAFEEENKKLKKKIRQLQHRIKRQDEAQRVSQESLQAERELGSREEYVLMSLKKKYDDLLQYVLKVESENQKLKSLTGISGEGDEFLHDYDQENSEYERRAVARLQTDLETLRAEMMKKDHYILECEERLHDMDALKEENLALHKSYRHSHETDAQSAAQPAAQPDPRDISKALEEEWMQRLSETREMYERAIEGYRDQLQEMQEKYQKAEENHTTHVEELMQDINELKVGRTQDTRDPGVSSIGGTQNTHDPGVSRIGGTQDTHDPGVSRIGGTQVTYDPGISQVGRPQDTYNPGISRGGGGTQDTYDRGSSRVEGTQDIFNPGISGVGERQEIRNPAIPRAVGRKPEDEGIGQANSDSDSDETSSISEDLRGKSKNNEEVQRISGRPEYKRAKESKRDQRMEKTVCDKNTQTSSSKSYAREEARVGFEDGAYSSEILGPQEEMQESKEYLERVNHLVKKLESMKLNGDGAEAILAVIRDTINQCLHEWRETFQQQKALQKDSADELNKGYVELQRKLRAKSKQLESKHKQCKHLEEQNTKLTEKCNWLEAKVAAFQTSDQLGMLQDLPQTLRNTELRLSEFQEALQKAQGEKNSLQEQIKLLSEKLNRKEMKLVAEHEEVRAKEKEMKRLQEKVNSLKHQLDEVSREVISLKEQLATKDTILEHTSAQLEERIRECAGLSSQIERQKTEISHGAKNIQVQLNEHESASHKQLMEAQALSSRYQAQLSALRSEKDHNEKSLRHNLRKLEEQVDQLQLRNSTLQRQLTTITTTYHSMFTSVDINPLSSPGMGSSSVK